MASFGERMDMRMAALSASAPLTSGPFLRGVWYGMLALWTGAALGAASGAAAALRGPVLWAAAVCPAALIAFLHTTGGGKMRSGFWTLNCFAEWVEPVPTAILGHVLKHAPEGDADAVVREVDKYCWRQAPMTMNVGDVKGEIVDEVLRKCRPSLAVELGAFMGYSTVRWARLLPEGSMLHSVDPSAMGHAVQAKLLHHAGLAHRVNTVFGYSGDHLRTLAAQGKKIDFLFIDHVKTLYLSDLQLALDLGLLRKGSVVVADNVLFPGAPDYKEWILKQSCFRTDVRRTFVEYNRVIEDEVLISEYIGDE